MPTVNIKNHAKTRYCERIEGLKDATEIKHFIVNNDERITNAINKMVEHSHFMYRGQIGDNTTKVFRMADNIILVMDSQQTCVITLYKCFFDFGEDMDRTIIKHELQKLDELHAELAALDTEIDSFVEERQVAISTFDATIKALEAQVASIRTQKGAAEEEIKAKRSTRDFTVKEIDKRAVRICNSLEYRKDLNQG